MLKKIFIPIEKGALKLMGERNYLTQMTSDLIERKKNKNVVDLIDVGTAEDYNRFCNYQGKIVICEDQYQRKVLFLLYFFFIS